MYKVLALTARGVRRHEENLFTITDGHDILPLELRKFQRSKRGGIRPPHRSVWSYLESDHR
jgi:hypothetical protein